MLGLDDWDATDELLGDQRSKPSGTLCISFMPGYGQVRLMPVLQDFSVRYPRIHLDVHLSDELEDLGGDQFGIVIRGGAQPESRVISRRLDPNRFILTASPTYLAAHGTPNTLDGLGQSFRAAVPRPEQRPPKIRLAVDYIYECLAQADQTPA